ncbi:MAG: 50S ribosomal protein L22 [Rickettsiales bacterium]
MSEKKIAEEKNKVAIAKLKSIKTSVQKLNLVASLIRGMKAEEALVQLTFAKQKVSSYLRDCLNSAIANAENNHDMDIDSLYVSKVLVGKSFTMKRFKARARGRGAKILKPFSNLTIEVEER